MRTTLTWFFVPTLIALIIPCQASALVLGDITLNSSLNQPLDAQIKILPDQVDELNEVRIGLASESAYVKAGIERRTPPDLIKFKVAEGKDGIPVIEVTSRAPIKEPLLDFILEVNWPDGHLMREYTVLLDPPAATREAAAQAPATGVSGAGVVAEQAVVPQRAAETAALSPVIATRSIEPKLTHDTYGPTMRPDTLWPIAKAVRPDPSVSIEQVMLALVKKNSEAFYNDNVNELKAGYVLHIPDMDLIGQVSEADAAREVKLQYQRWKQSRQGTRPPADMTKGAGEGQSRASPASKVTSSQANVAAGGRRDNLVQADMKVAGENRAQRGLSSEAHN